jgi:hypothetical protein
MIPGFPASEAHDYMMRPGYLEIENGYTVMGNGIMIAIRTEIPHSMMLPPSL